MNWIQRMMRHMMGEPPTLHDVEPEPMNAAEFLEWIEQMPLDDPMPFSLVTRETLMNMLRADHCFYDKIGQRWWMTPQGKQWLIQHRQTRATP